MEICHVVVSFVKIGQVKAYFVHWQGDSPLVLSMGEVLCKRLTWWCWTLGGFMRSGAGKAVICLWAKMKLHLCVYR